MKFFGQSIYDFISRFRNDVYLEDISTGTIASGGNLGLDSNNKIVKATEATGDITSVAVGSDGVGLAYTSGDVSFTISGGNAITTSAATNEIRISHDDTSSQASVNNSGRTYIQDITLDTYGHVTALTSATETVTNTDTDTIFGLSSVNGSDVSTEIIRLSPTNNEEIDPTDVTLAVGTGLSIANESNKITVTNTVTNTDTQLTTEQVQDVVGAMFSGNTETNITATYQDADGTIDLAATDTNTQLSNAEVRTAVEAATDSNVFTDTDHNKLDDIEASADVTDTANVTSAGALMDSELTDLAGVKGMTVANKANVASPTFTGTPAAPTAAAGTNTTQIATTAHVKTSIDERFTYQYIQFIGNADIATNWGTPGTNGPFTHNYNTDTGTNGTSVGSTSYNFARAKQLGFVVPYDSAILVGFYGMIRNNTASNQGALGLFHSAYSTYGAKTTTSAFVLQAYGTADTTGAAGSSYQGFTKVVDLSRNFGLTAGDMILPAIMQASEKAFATFTVVIKTPIL